ncbi:hypothetical protein DFH09DRAFT_1175448 [Mycena vulgaris]|nr:hypothetical protein DFH09DRAFT_1175448 [Mycena vulgaris]
MKFATLIAFVLAAVVGAIPSGPKVGQRDVEGLPFPVVPATFGPFTVGGTNATLSGTVESVIEQLKVLDPTFEISTPSSPQDTVKKRNKHLRRDQVSHYTAIGLDGHQCSRISCSYNAAIYFCNDNNGHISPQSFYLASYAADILPACSAYYDYSATGQEFDTDNYNIIVRSDNC